MLKIDLSGKRAFVAGVADDRGFGWAIARSLAEAGASVCVGTWPPALGIFESLLRQGKLDEAATLSDGRKLEFEQIIPFEADFDSFDKVPDEIKQNRRYRERGDFTIHGAAAKLVETFGTPCVDIVVHSVANGREVKNPLLETSRDGYLAAVGASAYSFVSLVQALAPHMRPGGSFLSLSYLAAERFVPGYGGGMNAAKAALESDMRVLAHEVGRKYGLRVNTISAGPYASRAATATGYINEMIEHVEMLSPIRERLTASEVANTAAFLASALASGITGTVIYVDKGYHSVGVGGEKPGP